MPFSRSAYFSDPARKSWFDKQRFRCEFKSDKDYDNYLLGKAALQAKRDNEPSKKPWRFGGENYNKLKKNTCKLPYILLSASIPGHGKFTGKLLSSTKTKNQAAKAIVKKAVAQRRAAFAKGQITADEFIQAQLVDALKTRTGKGKTSRKYDPDQLAPPALRAQKKSKRVATSKLDQPPAKRARTEKKGKPSRLDLFLEASTRPRKRAREEGAAVKSLLDQQMRIAPDILSQNVTNRAIGLLPASDILSFQAHQISEAQLAAEEKACQAAEREYEIRQVQKELAAEFAESAIAKDIAASLDPDAARSGASLFRGATIDDE